MSGTFSPASPATTTYPLQVQAAAAVNTNMSGGCGECTQEASALAGTNGAGMNGAYYIFLPSGYETINGVTTPTGGTTFFAVVDNAFMYTGSNYIGGGFIIGYFLAMIMSLTGTSYASLVDELGTSASFQMIGPFHNNLSPTEIVQCNPFYGYGGDVLTSASNGDSSVTTLFQNQYVQGTLLPMSLTCQQTYTPSPTSPIVSNAITLTVASNQTVQGMYLKSCDNDDRVSVPTSPQLCNS